MSFPWEHDLCCGMSPAGAGRLAHASNVALMKSKQVVPQYDDIERLENDLYEASWGEWQERTAAAIEAALSLVSGKAVITASDAKRVAKALQKPFKGWPSKELEKLIGENIEEMYGLAQ